MNQKIALTLTLALALLSRVSAAESTNLPPAVESAVRKLLNGATLGDVERKREGGELVFEVELMKGGVSRVITLDLEGVPIGTEIFENELPPAAQRALKTELGTNGKLEAIVRSIDEGEIAYDLEIARNGTTRVTTIRASGVVVSRQISAAEVPAAVRNAFAAHRAAGTAAEYFRAYEGRDIYYVVRFELPEKSVWVTFGPAGRVVGHEEKIHFTEAPAPVQQAILQRLNTTEHVRVVRRREGTDLEFDVLALRNGGLEAFTVSAAGKIDG
ncbi:MAG: hypothetical protein HY301_02775 [Verrucomicrobia bacterium]|nr:hypothetical protein [Verrucomicrobiota bacterium]